jgi:polyhydroxybutyrate depolymerase
VPVIAFHGTADRICPYNGGPSKLGGGMFPNIPEFFAKWSQRNQCGSNPLESTIVVDASRLQYTCCATDADVVLYTIKGEGHQWPGGRRVVVEWLVGPYNHSINATREMWAFFQKHPLTTK